MEGIEIRELTKSYGKARGVDKIHLSIQKGEVFGFIGPNGAGKSTTIRCIMDLINKNKGEISIEGKQVKRNQYKIREKIGYLPSEIHLYEDLTVEKMLKYAASFYKKDCNERMQYLIKKLEVDTKKKIEELSLGNLKKIGIIISLMHCPEILILDEPTSGLDPLMQEAFYEIIEEEKQRGTTIFFSSHILSEIKRVCDRVAIIKEGKIIRVDKIEDLLASSFYTVTLVSEQIEEIKKEKIGEIQEEKKQQLKILSTKDSNELIQILAKYAIKRILIEEPSIEDIFMNYYK